MGSENSFGVEGLPADAPEKLRLRLGLDPAAPLRISYIPGPGDLAGTYECWRRREHDPRSPIITYSAQFFKLVKRLGMDAQIFVQTSVPKDQMDRSLSFHRIARGSWNSRKEYFAAQNDYGNRVCSAIDGFAPHLILAATDFPSAFWPRLGRSSRRLLLTAHNTFWPMGQRLGGAKGVYRKAQVAWRARSVDDAICTSAECARQIAQVTLGRVQGLVQIPQIAHRHAVKRVSRVRNLLYLGRIEHDKGVFMLLDAFAALKSDFPDLTLVFAGAGSATAELEALIAKLDDPRVSLVGKLDGAAVHRAIDAADLLVCPTRTAFNEGLAVVGFEAAAHGVPSLMSSIVPAIDALGEGCAVFEADSQDAMEAELRDLIVNEGRVAAMSDQLAVVREALYDRDRSWGSQLARVVLRI